MASRWEKAAGLGATGWSLGGPVGGAVGAGLGFLFGSDDQPELGDFQFSPDALKSINFSDLDLESMNPELYKKLQQNDLILKDLQGALAQRREGLTANEQRQQSEYLNSQASGQASSGLAGTPIGNAMMADSAARLNDAARERAYQEAMGLRQAVAQQGQANLQGYGNAQGQLIGQFNQNRQSALAMDQLRNSRDLDQFKDQQQSVNANTGMYGGLLNGGLSGIASQNFTGGGPMLGDLGGWIGSQFGSSGPQYSNSPGGSVNGYTANHGAIPNIGWQPNYAPAPPQEVNWRGPGGQGYGAGLFR